MTEIYEDVVFVLCVVVVVVDVVGVVIAVGGAS